MTVDIPRLRILVRECLADADRSALAGDFITAHGHAVLAHEAIRRIRDAQDQLRKEYA